MARFSKPNLTDICLLKIKSLPQSDNFQLNSKLPVSQDQNIDKLLEKHPVDVVISSSALNQLSDYTDTNSKWIIPVVIKWVTVKLPDGIDFKKKVVYIDKVLPKTSPTLHEFRYYGIKKLVKSNFCHFEAFRYVFLP